MTAINEDVVKLAFWQDPGFEECEHISFLHKKYVLKSVGPDAGKLRLEQVLI